MNETKVMRIAHTQQEKDAIYAFRYQVYVEEMGKPYADADHERRMLYDDLDELSLLLYVNAGEELTGTLRLNWCSHSQIAEAYDKVFGFHLFNKFPLNSFSVTSRLAVAPKWRRTSITPLLFQTSYELGAAKGDKFNFIHCSPRVLPIMEHYGFRQYRKGFYDPNSGEQIPMVLAMSDHEYFRAIRSPFLSQSLKWFRDSETGEWFQTHVLPNFQTASSMTRELQPA